jgi:hypothetical protein
MSGGVRPCDSSGVSNGSTRIGWGKIRSIAIPTWRRQKACRAGYDLWHQPKASNETLRVTVVSGAGDKNLC